MKVPFNRPYQSGKELKYLAQAQAGGHLSGDGPFTHKCHAWLEEHVGCRKALLTPSCTAALEMAAILADIRPGDEVILPSYAFVSTANAFVLRGGVPLFVDIRPDTLNIDERRISEAVTERTKAIVPVHYAGVGCEMDTIMEIADKYGLLVVEDAAQGILAGYRGRPLGSIGHLAAFSFHETKNVSCGEGGALLINDPRFVDRAEIVREKGTDRSRFLRGQVDKYTWVDIGSSYLPSELNAAVLWAQLEQAGEITARRRQIWSYYHSQFRDLEEAGKARRPIVPAECAHNAHSYHLQVGNLSQRDQLIAGLKAQGIGAAFHYVPLHDSPAGGRYGRTQGTLPVTREVSDRLVRLPLWAGMEEFVPFVVDHVKRELHRVLE